MKEFEFLNLDASSGLKHDSLVVTCHSDGAVRVWALGTKELTGEKFPQKKSKAPKKEEAPAPTVPQVWKLLGTYETGNRITCMKAFVMLQPEEDKMDDSEAVFDSEDEEEEESSDSDNNDD